MDSTTPAAPEIDSGGRRFLIGIDLGTTNSAVAFVDLATPAGGPHASTLFQVPQLTAAGTFSRVPVLPSFVYLPGDYDIDREALHHPWPRTDDNFVGTWARDHGGQVPARLVASAKSWLCHGKVDRHARILPWGAPAEVRKISPIQASAAYLGHIRKAWNHSHGDEEELFLENQTVILTVPASFDEVARELTLAAAEEAGLRQVILLEEPLAAFYSWLARHEQRWEDHVRPGQLILICDVGGGTTDFTLVTLTADPDGGSPRFERIAVGDHLLLGGDNMDLALARQVEAQWRSGQQRPGLDTHRWQTLCHQCRQAKEQILSGRAQTHRVTLMGTGGRLIAGTLSAELDGATVERTILEGFFPLVARETEPAADRQRPAITEFGLPYEAEPAITRHLMRFLERHRQAVAETIGKPDPLPDLVLFNGGALTPATIQQRIVDALGRWFTPADDARPTILENRRHDLAVAQGAAYYGLVKAGKGLRVGSGSPRGYYLGVGQTDPAADAPTADRAICVVPRGLDEGSHITLADHQFEVRANEPVRIDLFSSSYRSRDRSADLVAIDDTFSRLPPLQTVIRYGKKGSRTRIPVHIEAEYTELGALRLWCRSRISEHRWRLQFQLRDNLPADTAVQETIILEEQVVQTARQEVREALTGSDAGRLDRMAKTIATAVDLPREQWPLRLLRELADQLIELLPRRAPSPAHEARWMNLTGYCLRPGFGDSLDPERIQRIWKIFNAGPLHPNHAQVQSEWWILWRRLAGGFTPGQQRQLSQEWTRLLQPKKGKKSRLSAQHQLELWMAIANLERLYVNDKIQWGRLLLAQLTTQQAQRQQLWSLARIGARELLYGSADRVIPPDEAARWIDHLLDQQWPQPKIVGPALAQLARKTGDRTRDIDDATVDRIRTWMAPHPELSDQGRFLETVVPIARQEEQTLFGESLPAGLILR
ncbi:MAG: hsp70 family protein [Desulfatitalea sp.]|nr:hsp70 family protein [Desulfatitalea sp.]